MLRRIRPLFAGLLIGAGIGVAIIFGFSSEPVPAKVSESIDDSIPVTGIAIGNIAPDFELTSISGEQISLEDLRGHPVIINFWATWCGPCRLEMPAFQAQFEQYEGNLKILAVNFDESLDDVQPFVDEFGLTFDILLDESLDDVQPFVDEFGLTFDILLDPGAEIQQLYQVRGYPKSYFLDTEGVIQIQHIGLIVESQLDEYLASVGLGQ
jgi:peroxiredoxin